MAPGAGGEGQPDKGAYVHRAKQTASIEKLQSDMAKLTEEVSRLQQGITERDGRIRSLKEEVESERCHKVEAQESARSDSQSAENLKLELVEERSAHQATKATVQALEADLARLDSEEHKTKVVEEYRHSSLDRTKVALACKAGVDYLASLLPPESRPTVDRLYPPRVTCCLDLLKELRASGGGTLLALDDGDDDDELEDDREEVALPDLPSVAPAAAVGLNEDLLSPTPDHGQETCGLVSAFFFFKIFFCMDVNNVNFWT